MPIIPGKIVLIIVAIFIIQNHGKIVKNLYYSKKYNLCSICFNVLEKENINTVFSM